MTLEAPPPSEWPDAQPYERWRDARAVCPVHRLASGDGPGAGVFAVTRFAEAERVLRDWATYSSAHYASTMGRFRGVSFREMDGPEHRRHRGHVAAAFRATVLARWEDELIRPVLHDLIDRIAPLGRADLVRDVTVPYPVQVICEILGLPRDDHDRFVDWADKVNHAALDEAAARVAADEMTDYFLPLVHERRRAPRGDLLSELVVADVDGAHLDDDQVLGFLRLLMPAGAETTTRAFGNALAALLSDPARLTATAADPSSVPAVVEETLRWETPVTMVQRVATHDAELGDVEIPAGSMVLVLLGSADHDESRWPDPDTWDARRDLVPNLAFGTGPHQCVGMHLARLELRAGIETVLARLPGLRPDPDAATPVISGYAFRGPDRLAVRFDPS